MTNKEDCGKWIFHKDFNAGCRYGCNQCGNLANIPSNFCPNCGKRMILTGADNEKET
jgi:rRNA maturation endonuclease Nob1